MLYVMNMMTNDEDIRGGIENIYRYNLQIRENEKILVLGDYIPEDKKDEFKEKFGLTDQDIKEIQERCDLSNVIAKVGQALYGSNVTFLSYPLTGAHGGKPPERIAEAMKNVDAIIALTTHSITHTNATKTAVDMKKRVVSMPGFSPDMFSGPMNVDYEKLRDITNRLKEQLNQVHEVKIVASNGTDLDIKLSGKNIRVDTGDFSADGSLGNLPAGEVFTAPIDANGKLVVDPGWYKGLDDVLTFTFKNGEAVDIEAGGKVGEDLRIKCKNPQNRRIAELGIGTNENAKRPDNLLESEKILGTIHVAIGDSKSIGGENEAEIHMDFVVNKPNMIIDGKKLMIEGKLKL
jgi:leucyl aminopeptidase (aminopeptidase T)